MGPEPVRGGRVRHGRSGGWRIDARTLRIRVADLHTLYTPPMRSYSTIAAAAFALAAAPTLDAQDAPAAGAGGAGARTAELPLKAARNVAFTTDEGTWLSIDISPDGRTIVTDIAGDLYTIPITGGKATRLTDGLPFDAQPRWSPDGKKIVYI